MSASTRSPEAASTAGRSSGGSFVPRVRAIGSWLLSSAATLLLISFGSYALLYLVGDPAIAVAGSQATLEDIERVRQEFGFDRPLFEQYLDWLGSALTGDLGVSYTVQRSVIEMIGESLPITISLSLTALVLATVVATGVGVVAGLRPEGRFDRFLTTGAVLGIAVPNFLLGMVLVAIFAVWLGWLPATGYRPFSAGPLEWARFMLLPAVTLGVGLLAQQVRTLRSSMIKEMDSGYVRTARAKHLSEPAIVVKHAARNALLPIVTVIGLQMSRVITGAILVEQVFAIPGIGQLTVRAVAGRDLPLVQGLVVLFAATILLANLLVDLTYGWLNPSTRRTR